MPDLILLDGGAGHLSVISKLLDSMGISVPIFGMVKDGRHRTRAITTDGGEISITAHKETYKFKTEEQLKYFMMGVDEAEGWLEYQIVDENEKN